jgi:pectate disaccharide-lyase
VAWRAGSGGVAGPAAVSGGTAGSAQAGSAGSDQAGAVAAGRAAAGSTAAGGGAAGAPSTGQADDLWISPQGDDTHAGTASAPLKSIGAAVERAKPGITIWVQPGTYASGQTIPLKLNGDEQHPIRVFAMSSSPAERPVFDFSAQKRGDSSARGFAISGTYWHLRGIEVVKAGDNCIHISGSHNTIEDVIVHGCEDTGIQITANSSDAADKTRAANNTILNCDSYENYDSANQGENADGFAAKLYIGPGNVFRGCRAWNNSDDGWDLFASDDVVEIDHSWAISNGKIGAAQNNTNGDGNGFKLGGAPNGANQGGAPHKVTHCASITNRACGFVLNNNSETPQLSMCGGQGDGKGLFCKLTNSGPLQVTSGADAAIKAQRLPDGSLPELP